MTEPKPEKRSYKITIIGDSNVGKTSIVHRLCKKVLNINSTCPTIGAAFQIYNTNVKIDDKTIQSHLEIWDTAGQERFRALVPMYMRGAHGVILVFDLTNKETLFNLVKIWLPFVNDYISQSNSNNDNIIYYIIGNKYDLVEKDKTNGFDINENGYFDRINELTKGNYKYFEVSAYTNHNIEKSFNSLAEELVQKINVPVQTFNSSFLVIKNGNEDIDTGYFPKINCC